MIDVDHVLVENGLLVLRQDLNLGSGRGYESFLLSNRWVLGLVTSSTTANPGSRSRRSIS